MFLSSSPPPEPSPSFFRLPLELRQQIYALLLPSTTTLDPEDSHCFQSDQSSSTVYPASERSTDFTEKGFTLLPPRYSKDYGIIWQRGCTTLLAVNQQMHEECAAQLYGSNVFVIDVTYNYIRFRYRWLVRPSNLTPIRDISFLDHFSQRNLQRIRHYAVNVEHVDSYTGMVKYNCGGNGLPAGLRNQVKQLVDVMRCAEQIHRLRIHLNDGNRSNKAPGRIYPVRTGSMLQPQAILEPFKSLRNIRTVVITGAVTKDYSDELENRIVG